MNQKVMSEAKCHLILSMLTGIQVKIHMFNHYKYLKYLIGHTSIFTAGNKIEGAENCVCSND